MASSGGQYVRHKFNRGELEMIGLPKHTIWLLFAACLFCAATAGMAQDSATPKSQFLSGNPNSNGWEVGFLDECGNLVAYNSTFDNGKGIAGWALNKAPGPEGAVTINYSDKPVEVYGMHWEPGQICVMSPLHGQGVVLRWTAPEAADVQIDLELVCLTSGVDPQVSVNVDSNQLIAETSSDASVADALIFAKNSDGFAQLTRSAKITLRKGSKVDLIISPLDQGRFYHLKTFINVSSVSTTNVAEVKTSLGFHGSAATASKSVVMGKAD